MWKPSRPVLVLVVVAAVAGFFLGGATAKDSTVFGGTVAAWAQAIFAALAVFAAAWLQERFVTRQSQTAQRRIHENAASAARWVLQSFEKVQTSVEDQRLKGRDFVALEGQGALTVSVKALAEIKLSDIDDRTLATAVFTLQGTMDDVIRRRDKQIEVAGFAPEPIVTQGWFSQDHTTVFNQAASVERRAAELSGRRSAL